MEKDSLRNVGGTDARTDTQVILYSVQCYALHWTDDNTLVDLDCFKLIYVDREPRGRPVVISRSPRQV